MRITRKLTLISLFFSISISLISTYKLKNDLYTNKLHLQTEILQKELFHVEAMMLNFKNEIQKDILLLLTEPTVIINEKKLYTSYLNAASDEFVYNPSIEENSIITTFNRYSENNPQVDYIYLGLEDSSYVMNVPIMDQFSDASTRFNYDPRTRPWYKNAKNSPEKLILTKFYHAPQNKVYFITATYGITQDNVYLGAIGLDINVDNLINYLQGVGIRQVGAFGIIFKDSTLLIEDNDNILINDIDKSSSSLLSDLTYNNQKGFGSLEDSYIFALKSEKLPHVYFFKVPKSNIEESILSFVINFVIIFVLTILLLSMLYFISVHIFVTKPILALTNEAINYKKSGTFNDNNLKKSTDEIGSLTNTFSLMFHEIKDHRENLENLVQDRTIELKKLTRVVEQSPTTILITDQDSYIEYVNPYFTEITGYTPEEVIGKKPNFFSANVNPKLNFKDLQEICLSGKVWNGEFLNKKKNGELYWEHASISALKVENDKKVHFISVKTDITEQKKYETELALAKEKAETAVKIKSDFLANMSHEIRTPMNAVIGLNNLILRSELNDKQRDFSNKIEKSASNLLGIINDILDFSKVEAGKLSIEDVEFSLDVLLDDIVTIVAEKAHIKGLELIIHNKNTPNNLIGDPLRLQQVIINLVSNAIKFTSQGEITITLCCEVIDDKNSILHCSVKDTGIGLSAKQLATLFNAFSQGDTSTTREYGGTGLGLIISKKLVTMMGGSINVESKINIGSNFYFNINLKLPSEKDEKLCYPQKTLNKQIIIIDNNYSNRMLLSNYFIDNFFHVINKATLEDLDEDIINNIDDNTYIFVDHIALLSLNKVIPKYAHIILMTKMWDVNVAKFLENFKSIHYINKPILEHQLFKSIINKFRFPDIPLQNIVESKSYSKNLINIKGSNILLVDDNEINTEIAKELLLSEDFNIDIATNGLEAVKLAAVKEYQIIFMDLQMPVMDGFQATKQIRQFKDYYELPIVALTADVLSSVEQDAMDCGMNDFLTKPLKEKELFKSLIKWIKPKNNESRYLFTGMAEALDRVNNNDELYNKLLNTFFSKHHNDIVDITQYIDSDNFEQAENLAHSLKGIVGNIGFNDLSIFVTELVEEIRSDIPIKQNIYNLIEKIFYKQFELKKILKPRLENKAKKLEETNNEDYIEIEMLKIIDNLKKSLEEYDIKSKDYILQLKPLFSNRGQTEFYLDLFENISAYNFEEALSLLKKEY
ncbi:MAG: ATP-binding protein [Spirochaetaceae bacterium]